MMGPGVRLTMAILCTGLLCSCTKDEPHLAKVTFHAQCGGCSISYDVNGSTVETVPMVTSTFFREAMVEEGQEVSLSGTPTNLSTTATMIWLKVDGWQQDFEMILPNDSADLGSTVRIQVPVRNLDRFGQ